MTKKVAQNTVCCVAAGIAIAIALVSATSARPAAQTPKRVRLNKIIELLEQGKPSIRVPGVPGMTDGDHVMLDLEGGSVEVHELVGALAPYGKKRDSLGRLDVTPIVRVGEREDASYGWNVAKVLSRGAFGVQFPEMNNKEQALRAVQAVRYPPQRGASNEKYPEPRGHRGAGSGGAAKFWGISESEYMDRADVWPLNPNGELFIVMQIETLEGVKNVKEILNTPGLGAIDVSPGDLHMQMGFTKYRLDNNMTGNVPEVEAVYQSVLKDCLAYNKTAAPNRKVACGGAFARSEIPRRIKEGWSYFVSLGG